MNRAFLVLCLLLSCGPLWAQLSISTSGSWSRSVVASDLAAGVGSDLASTYESVVDGITLSVTGTGGPGDTWRIDVKKVDVNWTAALRIYVRRTGSGSGGAVSGGTVYQQVTDADQTFFDGVYDVSGIGLQVQVGGVSVNVPPAAYSITLYFTIVDT